MKQSSGPEGPSLFNTPTDLDLQHFKISEPIQHLWSFAMGTVRAPLPQVEKLLLPLQERESALQRQVEEISRQLEHSKAALAGVQQDIQELLAWEPPARLLSLYADGLLKSRATSSESCADVHGGVENDDEEEEFFYDCEEDEDEAEPAPTQPDDPESAQAANEDEHVFAVLNAAMAVLRREHQDREREHLATGKRKMSLLDRCFFDVREYMRRLVASLPPTATRGRVPPDLDSSGGLPYQPHLIAGGSTQMGKTMFVVIGYVAAWFAKCPLVCLTTTVSGTKSLHKKVLTSILRLEGRGADGIAMHCSYISMPTPSQIDYFAVEIRAAERPLTSKGKKAPARIHKDLVARAGLGGSVLAPDCGIVFVADTAAQMRRAVKVKFSLLAAPPPDPPSHQPLPAPSR